MNKKNLSIGTWLTIPNEAIAEIFAQSGFEWIVIDLEHSAININQAEKLIRVIDLAGSKPMVRLSGHDSNQIKNIQSETNLLKIIKRNSFDIFKNKKKIMTFSLTTKNKEKNSNFVILKKTNFIK